MNLPKIFDSLNQTARISSINEVFKLNYKLKKYNLCISKLDAIDIVETRDRTLSAHGRVELNMSIINSIVGQIAKSHYINQDNLVETINDMYEVFHYIKNLTSDLLPDEKVLKAIMYFFNEVYNGSIDLLKGKGVDKIIDNFKNNKELTYLGEGDDAD